MDNLKKTPTCISLRFSQRNSLNLHDKDEYSERKLYGNLKHLSRSFCPLLNTFRYPYTKAVGKGKGKMHPCTGTEALYRPYGP